MANYSCRLLLGKELVLHVNLYLDWEWSQISARANERGKYTSTRETRRTREAKEAPKIKPRSNGNDS